MLKKLADRLVLWPSTNYIDPGSLERELIPVDGGHLEAWATRVNVAISDPKFVVIKFTGNAGRAECSTAQPASLWKNVNSEVWTINPFGYGGSIGPATLQRFPEMVDSVYTCVRRQFPNHRLLVYGNSIGSISALSMAAKYEVDGVCIRNPVPIHQLIATRPRYAWPSVGLSRLVSMQIPKTLDAIANAKSISRPCLFVSCQGDTMIPLKYQAKVINAFSGTKRVFKIPDADHNDPIPEALEFEYREAANWLLEEMLN